MKALRTVPAMLQIAETIERYAPGAWLINYSNPTGIVSQALHDNTAVRCVALCAGGLRPAWRAAEALGVHADDVQYDIFGPNPQFEQKLPSLQKRGGGGYSAVAMGAMDAIWNNRDTWAVANVPNRGVFRFLPDNAVIETGVLINANGVKPVTAGPPPNTVWGLVAMVKNHEMLTAEAAVSGNRDTAVLALTHHPLVGDYDLAEALFDRMLEVNRAFLPQFR